MSRNTNRSTTVGNTRAEVSNMASLMTTGETQLIVLSVDSNVLVVLLGELLNGSINGLHASRLTHRLGGVVGVASSTVPVSLKRLGVERDLDSPLFCNANKQITGHPQVISHGDTLTWTNLELPLCRHDFSVDTADVHTRVEASAVVGFDKVTSEDLASS